MRKDKYSLHFWPAFTDVMTGVFILFVFISIILISKNYFDLKELYSLKKIKDKVQTRLEAFNSYFPEDRFAIVNNEIKIVLDRQTKITFRSDKAEISNIIHEEGKENLKAIGNNIKSFLDKQGNKNLFGVMIEGYTDTQSSDEYNYNLSYHRSKNIMLFWRDSCGLDPNFYDINPVGYGELYKRLINKTDDGVKDAQNRRIEIRLVPKFGELFDKLK